MLFVRLDADACVGLVVCASSSRGTFRRMVLERRSHGSQRGCTGASPAQSCLLAQASVRTRRGGCASGRLAIRSRGRDAAAEDSFRQQEGLRNAKAAGQREERVTDRQSTGRGGHGRDEFLHRQAGCHRRTPHGRAFACGFRSSRHLESDSGNARLADARCRLGREAHGD